MRPAVMHAYGQMCGWTLARAHARSGDSMAIGAYLGSGEAFDRAMTEFADRYADQNERDFAAVEAAVDAGTLPVERGL
jgi:predicted alpha/beta hydrolase